MPFAPSNTARYWVDYVANGRQHSAQFRYLQAPGGSPPDAVFLSGVEAFFFSLNNYLPTDFEYVGGRFAVQGSDVTNPASVPGTGPSGSGVPTPSEAPAFISFIGRTSLGTRIRLFVLGVSSSPAGEAGGFSNYRVYAGGSNIPELAIGELQDLANVAVDGLVPVWKPYVNLGYHAYWQQEVRP